MPAPKTAIVTTRAVMPQFLDANAGHKLEQALHQRIAQRAYSLYEESGRQDGREQQNWARATAEILQPLEMRESGTWLALSAALPGTPPESIQIIVTTNRVIVQAERAANATFFAADFDVDVDPATATASFKDRILNLMVKKRGPGKVAVPSAL